MKKIAIISDDTCDLPVEYLEKYDIIQIPAKIIFSDKVFASCSVRGELTVDEYYRRSEKELPTSATPSQGIIFECIKKAFEKAESVIGIFLPSKMSPIASNAQIVVNQFYKDKPIKIHDSSVTSSGLAVLVLEAARFAEKGFTFEEINSKIEEWNKEAHYAGIMFTLENLVRTGRVPKTKKYMADFFKVKPVVKMINGEIIVQGKIRADEKLIINQMKKFGIHALENMIDENKSLVIGHTRWPEAVEEIAQYLKSNNPKNKEILIQETSPIIANFTGKKIITLGYIGNYDEKWLLKTKK